MDKRFNLNDIPNKIFTESSLYTSECGSLSSDNESLTIAVEGARNVIKTLPRIEEPGIIDEMKIMIKDTEKAISKNILLELYSFKSHFDGIKDGARGDFMACKYTNLNKCVPTLKPLLNLLTEVYTRLAKFHNHFTPDAKDDYEDTIDELYDMVRDKYEGSIYSDILKEDGEVSKTDFMEKMFLKFRNGNEYATEQYSADDLDEYENKVHECYLGIGDSVKEYNEDMIKCMTLFEQIKNILQHGDFNKHKSGLLRIVSLCTLQYLFIANIAYAGKADAVKSYLHPTNNDIECGSFVHNDDPVDIDDFEDIDDDDDDEFDWGLLDADEAVVESAFDTIDIQENYVPEYVDSPKLYVMEAQIMSVINEELMYLHEAPRWNQIRKAANAKQQAKNMGAGSGKSAGQIKDDTIAKWEKEATAAWKNWKPEDGQSKTWENFKKSGQYQKVWDNNPSIKAAALRDGGAEYTSKPATTAAGNQGEAQPAEKDAGKDNNAMKDMQSKMKNSFHSWIKTNKQGVDPNNLSSADEQKYMKEFLNSEQGKAALEQFKNDYIKNGHSQEEWNKIESSMKAAMASDTAQQQQQANPNTTEADKQKKEKKKKEEGILESMWAAIKQFFDKMFTRFGSAAGKYSADARNYVLDNIYDTYSKNKENQQTSLYPQYEGYYDKSVQRLKDLMNTIGNYSFSNKTVYDPDNASGTYDTTYFMNKILPNSQYDGTPLNEFCKTYFRGGDKNTKIMLTNFGPDVPKETFAAMIDLQLSAEMTSNQLAKTINGMIGESDKFTQKYIRNFQEEAELPGLIKDHIASVLEDYFDKDDYKAFTEEDQPAQQQQQQGEQKNTGDNPKLQKMRDALKAYHDVLMNIMAAGCTTYEVIFNRNKRILNALQTGDPIKNRKEKNQATVQQQPNANQNQQQAAPAAQQQQQQAQPNQQQQ